MRPTFEILIAQEHKAILDSIHAFFGVGKVIINGKNAVFRVQVLSELVNVIIPHFTAFPLFSLIGCLAGMCTAGKSYRRTFASSSSSDNSSQATPKKRTQLTKDEKAALSENLSSNQQLLSILIGLLLGDGYLQKMGGDARFCLYMKDKGFVQLVWDYLNALGILGAPVREYSHMDKRTGKTYTIYSFSTYTLPFFTKHYKQWYKQINGENVKILPSNLADLVTPISLAYWVAGDGSYDESQGCVRIYTNSFTRVEVELLQSILLKRFHLGSSINLHGGLPVLRIPKRELPKLQELVKDINLPIMRSRVGLNNTDST